MRVSAQWGGLPREGVCLEGGVCLIGVFAYEGVCPMGGVFVHWCTPPTHCMLGYSPSALCMLGYTPPVNRMTEGVKTLPSRRQRSCGKVIFSVLSVHHSVHREGWGRRGVPCGITHNALTHCTGTSLPMTTVQTCLLQDTCPLTGTDIWWSLKQVWSAKGGNVNIFRSLSCFHFYTVFGENFAK